jgi:hypothetical protein
MKKTNSMSLVLIIAGIMMCSTLFKSDALAGPKGDIIVRDLGNIDITIDGSFSDWPLDKFKKVSLKLKPTTEAKENPYHSASYSFVADGSDAELVFSATAAGDATLLLDAVSVGKAVDNFVANGSFETDDVPASPGYGDITDWTGGSGINDGGPFGDNGVIPDGAKLAFLQGTRMLSQQLTELEDGAEYVLAFYYNARSCCGGTIDFTVLVGDQELGSVSDVRPVGGENAYHSASYSFVADGSDPELVFSATAAGDATLLLDAVSVSKAVDNFVANGSFETDDVPASPGYGDITDWTGGSGINDGGPFGDNGVIPDGEKLAFVQGTKMLSQQLTGLEDGAEYVLDFYYNARNCCGGTIDLTVSVGGEELGSVSDVRPVGSENAVIEDTADASGDHIVFDRDRIGRFNGTGANAWQAGDSDFGSTVYFAHNDDYLYMLAVFIDDVYRMERDTSEYGATGYLNDGFEFFLDTRNNSDDCASEIQFPSFDPEEPNVDDFQLTVALNENFKPEDSPDDVLGVRQTIERGGDLELIGPDKGGPGGIYRDALDAVPGVDIAAKSFADLRAAGALNPEILANPNVTYSGYTVEMLIPFGKFTGFTPDHSMGFELFWRDVDTDDDEGKGGGNISWGTWGGETTVDCGNPETSLFHTSNWGQLIFDTANQLDEDGGAADPGNLVANGSFEADDVPAFPGYRAITGWTGGSGINDGGPFGDNGVIPDGAKLGFIQGTKAMSQQLTGLEAGTEYVLAFYYNARGWNAENSTIGITVSVGGEELGSVSDVEPVGEENAYHSASYSFVAAGSDAELVFSATADGDATLLLDAVSVRKAEPDNFVANGSFEADDVPAFPGYGAITDWTGGSGINDGGPFGDNGVIPDGAKLVFIQGTKAMSQQLTGLEAGAEYVLAFYYNARGWNAENSTIGFTVSVGGQELGSVSDVEPVGGENAYHSASYSFVAAASDVELVFSATADGDATLLLDAVSVGRPGKGGGSISIAQTGTQVTLEWLGELETAENVTGPWAAIEASSPLTFSPSDLARYYRGVQADIGGQPGGGDQVTWGPTPIFIDDLESGAEGWTHKAIEDGEDPWELGTPSSEDYGPVAAASGQNVWGTVLDDRYPDYSDASLRTPPIDLTGMEAATLVYTEFRDVEAPEGGDMYDMVQINILSASNPDGETLADELRSTAGSLRGWVSRWVKLPEEVLGEKIIIEFRFISDDLLNDYAGWYIDDVMVLPE